MGKYDLTRGEGRTRVKLSAGNLGADLIVTIYNENAHLGAVAVGEYDPKTERTSVSLITRLGHKDDAIAQQAAYAISKATKKPVCVIAGVHLDDITSEEIGGILKNSMIAVEEFVRQTSSL